MKKKYFLSFYRPLMMIMMCEWKKNSQTCLQKFLGLSCSWQVQKQLQWDTEAGHGTCLLSRWLSKFWKLQGNIIHFSDILVLFLELLRSTFDHFRRRRDYQSERRSPTRRPQLRFRCRDSTSSKTRMERLQNLLGKIYCRIPRI